MGGLPFLFSIQVCIDVLSMTRARSLCVELF